ncbi:MAG: hypothetical protein M3N91_13875 [Pseudomonadota bacterium]|nr:hypothetical protein [Pseudomonadota bacterium]
MIFTGSKRSWLLLSAVCAAANAAPPPAAPPASPVGTASAQSTVAPDESFLEFLGSDDVGDAAWWEFLKKAPPQGSVPPAPPPQDAKK